MHKLVNATVVILFVAIMTMGSIAHGQQRNYGGTITGHIIDEPKTIMENYDFEDNYFSRIIFNKLIAFNVINYAIVPDLAYKWDISPDATVYTFYLYKNVTFHDGVPMTSADVKFTYDSDIKENGYFAASLAGLDHIETPDNYTVKFVLKQPDAGFLLGSIASYYAPAIIPKHLYDTGTDVRANPYNRKPVGTGPYKFVEWVEGSHITLERNDAYFKHKPYLDKVIIRFSTNWAPILAGIESGEIDYTYNTPPGADALRLSKEPGIALTNYVMPTVLHLDLNEKKAPFNDVRVRQAISAALDLNDINNKAYGGLNHPERGMFLSVVSEFYNPNSKEPDYNVTRAEQLLDAAGLKRDSNGVRFSTSCISFMEMGTDETCTVIKDQLHKVGIEVTLQPLEWGTYVERVIKTKTFEMAIGGGLHGPDPSQLELFFSSTGYRNDVGYNNSRIDQLFTLGRQTVDEKQRQSIYFEIQDILAKDLPQISLMEFVWASPYRTEFQGWYFQPEYGMNLQDRSFDELYWTNAPPAATTSEMTTAQTSTSVSTPEAFPISTAAAIIVAIAVVAVGAYAWTRKSKSKTG